MKFELKIKKASFPNTKELELDVWDEDEGWKKGLRQIFEDDELSKKLLKGRLKEEIMKVIGDELEKYIEKAFEDKDRYGAGR